jgi:hypothetical protein
VIHPARAGGHTTCSAAISQGRQLPQEGWQALQAFPTHGHMGGLLLVLRLRFGAPRTCCKRHGSCRGNASTGRSSHGVAGPNKRGQKTLQGLSCSGGHPLISGGGMRSPPHQPPQPHAKPPPARRRQGISVTLFLPPFIITLAVKFVMVILIAFRNDAGNLITSSILSIYS